MLMGRVWQVKGKGRGLAIGRGIGKSGTRNSG